MSDKLLKVGTKNIFNKAAALRSDEFGGVSVEAGTYIPKIRGAVPEPVPGNYVGASGIFGNEVIADVNLPFTTKLTCSIFNNGANTYIANMRGVYALDKTLKINLVFDNLDESTVVVGAVASRSGDVLIARSISLVALNSDYSRKSEVGEFDQDGVLNYSDLLDVSFTAINIVQPETEIKLLSDQNAAYLVTRKGLACINYQGDIAWRINENNFSGKNNSSAASATVLTQEFYFSKLSGSRIIVAGGANLDTGVVKIFNKDTGDLDKYFTFANSRAIRGAFISGNVMTVISFTGVYKVDLSTNVITLVRSLSSDESVIQAHMTKSGLIYCATVGDRAGASGNYGVMLLDSDANLIYHNAAAGTPAPLGTGLNKITPLWSDDSDNLFMLNEVKLLVMKPFLVVKGYILNE